jgi:hypothetical protein
MVEDNPQTRQEMEATTQRYLALLRLELQPQPTDQT